MHPNKENKSYRDKIKAMSKDELYEECIRITQQVINDTMYRDDIVIRSCTGPDYDFVFPHMKMLLETESVDSAGNKYAIEVLRKDAFAEVPVDDLMEYYFERSSPEEELDVIVVVEEDLFGFRSSTYEIPYTCDRNARIFFIRRVDDASVRQEHSVLYEIALDWLRRHKDMRC